MYSIFYMLLMTVCMYVTLKETKREKALMLKKLFI